jgi:hypothetical protein
MKVNFEIKEIHFLAFALFIVFLGTNLFVYAFNASGTGGTPSIMGHSVDEIDWSKVITTITAGTVNATTLAATTLNATTINATNTTTTNLRTGGAIYMGSGSNSNFYGDSTNLAARTNGTFFVQGANGTGAKNVSANDYYVAAAGNKAVSTLFTPVDAVNATPVILGTFQIWEDEGTGVDRLCGNQWGAAYCTNEGATHVGGCTKGTAYGIMAAHDLTGPEIPCTNYKCNTILWACVGSIN